MGLTLGTKTPDNLPKVYSYEQTKNLINELNVFCKQNRRQLSFFLQFKLSQLQFMQRDWKKSMLPGTVLVNKKSNSKTYHIVLNMSQVYKLHQNMRHFEKSISDSRMTPSEDTPQSSNQCCICMDKTASMMLPCYHTFCPNCTQIHIIDKEEKKCPICRAQFHEDNYHLKQKIITVVGEQQNFINELKQIMFEIMRQLNSIQVKQIQKDLMEGKSQDRGAVKGCELREEEEKYL